MPDELTADQIMARAAPTPAAEHRPPQPAAPTQPANPTEATPPKTRPEQPPRPKQYEFIESGSKDLAIRLDRGTANKVAERLLKRKQVAEELSKGERPLMNVDRLLRTLGPDAVRKFESGTATTQDVAVAWFVIHDEILQKGLAVAKLVQDNPGRFDRLKNVPLIGLLAQGPQTQLADIIKRLSSEYTREIGFGAGPNEGWDPQRIENHLIGLNQLRLALEQSLFGRGFRDPLFDQVSTSIDPESFDAKTGNRLHDAIVKQLSDPEGILTQRFGGRTFLEVEQEDPVAAMQALFEAQQQALMDFCSEAAKNVLKGEKPEIDASKIEFEAIKLEAKPKPEDIQPLQEAATIRATEFQEVETRFAALKTKREAAANQLPALERTFLEKQASYNRQSPNLTTEITNLETQIAAEQAARPGPLPGGATNDQRVAHAQAMATISETIRNLQQAHTTKTDYRNRLLGEYAAAEAAFRQARREHNKFVTQIDGIEQAGGELETKKNAKKTADDALEAKNKEIAEGGSPENKERATALRRWRDAYDGIDTIIDRRYRQKHGDEFTRERLANTEERPDGQIDGAERIREHILGLTYKLPNLDGLSQEQIETLQKYQSELPRKMLSDEAIARAAIWVFRLDTARETNTTGTSLNDLLEDIRITRETLTATPLRNTGARRILEQALLDQDRELVVAVLPHLRRSQFQVGDLMRFLVHEGVKSAKQGNPYLALSEYYEQTQAELHLEPESIYRPGIGHAEVEGRNTTWDGEIANTAISRDFGVGLPLHFRVRENFERESINYTMEVEVNERFLQALPNNAPPGLRPAIQRFFYDDNGNLRSQIRGRDRLELARMIRERRPDILWLNIPQWLMLVEETTLNTPGVPASASERVLNELATTWIGSPDVPQAISSSVADNLLHRTPAERLHFLRGLSITIPINGVPLTEHPVELHNYRVDLDNDGEFFITDVTDPDPANHERHELNVFFQRRLEAYRQSLGVQTVNVQERGQLQQEFLQIQEALGMEIMRAQQRR